MPEPTKPTHPLASIGGLAGAGIGWGLSHYSGPSLWIPGVATILLFLLFTKTSFRPKFFLGAITLTGGHVIWFLVASFMGHIWSVTALDILILTSGIIWLWLRPGLVSAAFLAFIQFISLAYNTYVLISSPLGSLAHKALTVHCSWRLFALICLVVGYRKFKRDGSTETAPKVCSEGS